MVTKNAFLTILGHSGEGNSFACANTDIRKASLGGEDNSLYKIYEKSVFSQHEMGEKYINNNNIDLQCCRERQRDGSYTKKFYVFCTSYMLASLYSLVCLLATPA